MNKGQHREREVSHFQAEESCRGRESKAGEGQRPLTRACPGSSPAWMDTCPVVPCPFTWALRLLSFTLTTQSSEHTFPRAEKCVVRRLVQEVPGNESAGPRDTSDEPLMTFVGLALVIWKMRPSNCLHGSHSNVDTSALRPLKPFLVLSRGFCSYWIVIAGLLACHSHKTVSSLWARTFLVVFVCPRPSRQPGLGRCWMNQT